MSSETKPKTTKRDDAQSDAIMLDVPWEIARPYLEKMVIENMGMRGEVRGVRGGDEKFSLKIVPQWGKGG